MVPFFFANLTDTEERHRRRDPGGKRGDSSCLRGSRSYLPWIPHLAVFLPQTPEARRAYYLDLKSTWNYGPTPAKMAQMSKGNYFAYFGGPDASKQDWFASSVGMLRSQWRRFQMMAARARPETLQSQRFTGVPPCWLLKGAPMPGLKP